MKKDWITFAKVQATGNDFILVDDREINLKDLTPESLRFLCHRHWGIGADGLIFLQRKKNEPLRMFYFNADGSEGTMCGNGLRAAALYALIAGFCSEKENFGLQARDGFHAVRFNADETISVQVLINFDEKDTLNLSPLKVPQPFHILGFLQTGVPHLVLKTSEDIDRVPFLSIAPQLRHHSIFREGTNVNLIQVIDDQNIKVRTYERGVEAETLSCGTGVTASALLYWQTRQSASDEITILTKGGNLKVSKKNGRITLTGPAKMVFVGKINYKV